MPHHVGRTLGSYRLIRFLGEGSYAEVYLARNLHIRHYAAFKILKSQLSHAEIVAFRNEAQIIANLRHKQIVQLHYFDIENRTPYIVMDYAPHGTLGTHYPPGTRMPLDKIVAHVKQIVAPLQYIHERGLVHRDIKPQNILVGSHYELMLGDFGIATMSQSTGQQGNQEYRGTAVYAAPEQFQGHPRPASDQYALAVMVYEWLSGELPFHGSAEELMYKHLHLSPPPLYHVIPEISPAVEQVVLQALHKDHHQRFPDIQAFAQALEQAHLGKQLSVAWPPQIPTQPAPIVPVGTLLRTYQGHTGPVRTLAWSPDGKQVASGGDDGTVQVWDTNNGKTISVYHGHAQWVHAVSWSFDSKYVISVSGDREVHVSNAVTGHKDFMCHNASPIVIAVACSPKEGHIAVGTNTGFLHLWDATTRSELATFHAHTGRIEAVTWSPDGKYIASAGGDHTVQVWNTTKGQHVLTYQGHTSKVYTVSWSPDGLSIASAEMNGMVRIWDVHTGEDILTYSDHTGSVYGVSWSCDSRHLASASHDHTVQVWDTRKGETLFVFEHHEGIVHDVAWSPRDMRIASAGDDGTVQIWQGA